MPHILILTVARQDVPVAHPLQRCIDSWLKLSACPAVRIAFGLVRVGDTELEVSPVGVCQPQHQISPPKHKMTMEEAGLVLAAGYTDEGENHYYHAIKPPGPGAAP